jgi:two-component system, chemotaxis family, sensor kinase CheA
LDDAALLGVIARPGLSTATRVTNVSGRGVGVDAVRERVRHVGGTLSLHSAAGEGTCFTIRLPLTLAVGGALVARVGDAAYALPVAQIRETADAPAASLGRDGHGEVLRLRDEVIPVVRLGDALGVASPAVDASDEDAEELDAAPVERAAEAVVVDAAGGRVALLVDRIDGRQEVLVKPLPRLRGALGAFGGATILVDGTPALVLDVPALLTLARPHASPAGGNRSH